MRKKWTREERRKHIREKYTPRKQKIFSVVVSILIILIALYLTINAFTGNLSLQIVSALLMAVTLVLLFLSIWGGVAPRSRLFVLIILLIAAIVLVTVWAVGLTVLEQLIVSIIMGFILLILIAVAVFFVDNTTFEMQ